MDSATDVRLYLQNFTQICDAIARDIRGTQAAAPAPPSGGQAAASRPILRRGSSGEAVRELQRLLGGLTVDGQFGPRTEESVRAFQRRHNLTVDGVVGPITWGRLLA